MKESDVHFWTSVVRDYLIWKVDPIYNLGSHREMTTGPDNSIQRLGPLISAHAHKPIQQSVSHVKCAVGLNSNPRNRLLQEYRVAEKPVLPLVV